MGDDQDGPDLRADPARRPLLTRRLLLGATSVALIPVLVIVVSSPRSALAQTTGDLSILGAALLATLGCVSAARRGGSTRRAWTMLAVATGVWTTAQALWSWYGITRDHVYPFPSLADLGFVGFALPVVVGLLLFPRSSSQHASRVRAVLDAAVIAASVLFVSWATVLGPLYQAGGSGLTRVVGLGYPVADVLVGSVVLALGSRVPAHQRRPWVLLGAGLVVLAVTDSIYASQTLAGQVGTTGTPLAFGWISAFLLIAASSQVRWEQRDPTTVRHFTVPQELLPVLPLAAAVVVAANRQIGSDTFLLTNGLILLGLALAQQLSIAVEKVALANGLEATIERRTAELSSADARFRSLIQSSDDAIFSKTADGIITSWNPAAERLFGYTASEMLGQPVDLVVPALKRDEENEIRQLAATGGAFRSYETERVRKDGTVFPVALTVSPIYDGERVEGVSAIARDISEARARERELAAARTAAEGALSAKSDFLATMSHEIRTPMNGVIGLTGLLLRTELDDEQRRYATGVRGAGEALLGIIDDILDFSKLEAGKVELEEVDFDPLELVEEVGVLLAGAASSKGLELIAHGEPALPAAVQGDPGRLRQILINLTANAVKFTETGEVVLRVSVDPEPGDASDGTVCLLFEVIDTGIGIEEADAARLFEPFSQADASTTRRFGGTGLGLAISRRLTEVMGGRIAVRSELGFGSTFSVRLSLPVRPGARTDLLEPPLLQGTRVLVVDDNATNREILLGQLDVWGLHADERPDASTALAALREAANSGRPYDLALLDLFMPGVDGLDLAASIAADPALAGTRCMILSSSGSVDAPRARSAHVQVWISKPVRSSELHDALMRLSAPPVQQHARPVEAPQSAPHSGAAEVLVVEDNPVNQMVAQGILEGLGYRVTVAADGRQALRVLEQRSFSAVLMDCHMPEMDGFEATEELRRREAGGPRTPVIAMTAGVLAADRARCTAAGMDDFVAKPVDVQHLEQTLARWVNAPGPGATPARAAVTAARLEVLRRLGPADGWGLLPRVIDSFLTSSPAQLAELRTADAATAETTAHRLRGAAGNLGAERLAELCAEAEELAARGDALPAQLLDHLDHELADVCAELERVVAS